MGGTQLMDLAARMREAFKGRTDVVAEWTGTHFQPVYGEPMTEARVKAHLAGETCAGVYLTLPTSDCWCSCADIDDHGTNADWRNHAERVYAVLQNTHPPLIEVSQSGAGAHLWLFFRHPVACWLVRQFWQRVGRKAGVELEELYPRQDYARPGVNPETGKPYPGNLVRLPLWNRSAFIDVEDDWSTVDPLEALADVKRITATTLHDLAADLRLGRLEAPPTVRATASRANNGHIVPEVAPRIAELLKRDYTYLAKRWRGDVQGLSDPSNSGLAMSIAVELVRQYVEQRDVEHALAFWLEERASVKAGRDDWVRTTVSKAYEFVVSRREEKSKHASTLEDCCLSYVDSLRRGERMHFGSGIKDVDFSVDGVAPGEVCVIGARPGHGKTALALQWLDAVSQAGTPCLLLSEEMPPVRLGYRRMLTISNLPEEHHADNTDALEAEARQHHDGAAPCFVVTDCQRAERAAEVIDQFCSLHNVRMVAVDYGQLLPAGGGTEYERITNMSRILTSAARRNGAAMLLLVQLNRELEKRAWKPRLSDLRDAGQIEADADLVLVSVWPSRAGIEENGQPVPQNEFWLSALKRRNGAIKDEFLRLSFDAERQRLE
jgi:replicative DNA helicase